MNHKYPYTWKLEGSSFTKDKGKVFSCFACGGGSTMGYKLAGFDVIGCNEIDPKINEVYVCNHNPKYNFNCDIRELVSKAKDKTIPKELYDLDILDGSPPCSTFSIAGNRESDWGKEKKFREGQTKQILDTLFFDFIDLAKELKPKVIVAENVKGLLIGTAINYVINIYKEFEKAGYYCQHFLLNSENMGVPQSRERVFFICIRHDLGLNFLKVSDLFNVEPYIKMDFREPIIPFKKIYQSNATPMKQMSRIVSEGWDLKKYGEKCMGETYQRVTGKRKAFSYMYLYKEEVCGTLTAHVDNACYVLFEEKRLLSKREWSLISSFPLDYNFLNLNPGYVMGMSVPPVMMAQIASQIWEYWLSKL